VGVRLGTGSHPVTARARPSRLPVVLLALAFAGVFAGALLVGWEHGGAPDLSAFDGPIEAAAREFRLDADLLRAMVAAESSGRSGAVSGAGARGLLQLMPETAREQARRIGAPEPTDDELFEPAVNVRLGAAYLARLLERFGGQEPFAIAAYNAGPTPVERWRRAAPDADALEVVMREGYEETRNHVSRVLGYRRVYRSR
jgi:soluble lytic murein transglycosylase-like protein